MSQAIETEILPDKSTALVVRQEQTVAPNNLFGADNAVDVVKKAGAVASALKGVVKAQGLISNIKGKEYPRCEAWTLLGTMLGVFPVLTWTRKLENGWEARVEAKTRDGAVVGAAEAECLRTEANWKSRDDFALRSMAQTRATAKALRMPLGFVMTLAGYEATPAEEMGYAKTASEGSESFDDAEPSQDRVSTTKQAEKANSDPNPATPEVAKTRQASSKTMEWMLKELKAGPNAENEAEVTRYFVGIEAIMPNETLADLPLNFVPTSKEELLKLSMAIMDFSQGDPARKVIDHNPVLEQTEQEKRRLTPEERAENEEWRSFPMPFGNDAGVKLEDLDKKKLFGWWANFKVETEYNGKSKKPETIAKDRKFREMLDRAGEHYNFEKKD